MIYIFLSQVPWRGRSKQILRSSQRSQFSIFWFLIFSPVQCLKFYVDFFPLFLFKTIPLITCSFLRSSLCLSLIFVPSLFHPLYSIFYFFPSFPINIFSEWLNFSPSFSCLILCPLYMFCKLGRIYTPDLNLKKTYFAHSSGTSCFYCFVKLFDLREFLRFVCVGVVNYIKSDIYINKRIHTKSCKC